MVMRRRRLERFGHVKRRDETENIRAVVEMKMEGKRPRGRPKLSWKDTVRPEGPESLEHQEGMGHCQGTMGRSQQDLLPRTGRRRRLLLLFLLLNFISGTYAHNDKGPENT